MSAYDASLCNLRANLSALAHRVAEDLMSGQWLEYNYRAQRFYPKVADKFLRFPRP
jgi:hypothetical protein